MAATRKKRGSLSIEGKIREVLLTDGGMRMSPDDVLTAAGLVQVPGATRQRVQTCRSKLLGAYLKGESIDDLRQQWHIENDNPLTQTEIDEVVEQRRGTSGAKPGKRVRQQQAKPSGTRQRTSTKAATTEASPPAARRVAPSSSDRYALLKEVGQVMITDNEIPIRDGVRLIKEHGIDEFQQALETAAFFRKLYIVQEQTAPGGTTTATAAAAGQKIRPPETGGPASAPAASPSEQPHARTNGNGRETTPLPAPGSQLERGARERQFDETFEDEPTK